MNPEIKTSLLRVLPFALILAVIFFRLSRNKIDTESIALQKPVSWRKYFICAAGFAGFILATEFILYQCGLLQADPWNHPLVASVLRISGAVVLAPVVEEILFRGFILTLLSKKCNLHLAIFIQAVFFVLLHNFTYENTVCSNIGIVQGLLDATLFGYARYYTRSLYTPMTMHITGNAIATLERFIL